MAVTIKKISDWMEELAPRRLASATDNVGLLVGNFDYETERILLALDATNEVIDEAIEKNCNLILTHHPLMRDGVKRVNNRDYIGKKILKLAENKIGLFAAHTNLDKTKGGVNDNLCKLLGLESWQASTDEYGVIEFMRIGSLPEEMTLEAFSVDVKKRLNLEYVPTVGDPSMMVKKIAIVGGSGMSMLEAVLLTDVDVFISGDVKYHDAARAYESGLGLLDITHYGGEVTVLPALKEYLEKKRATAKLEFDIIISEINAQPLRIYE